MEITTNPLSNLSYTNKDFQTIYPELIEVVKKLSVKWDPSISNESDPGVLLIKLNAILADRDSYNIDKNVLEYFPETVTQPSIANLVFSQQAYRMHQYIGAETAVTISVNTKSNEDLTDEQLEEEFSLPLFSMVSDSDNTVVYTLIANENSVNNTIPSQISLKRNGDSIVAHAIQGVYTSFTVNGDTRITAQNLDNNNKIYFNDVDIAENGIYINNVGNNNYNAWKRVDNLSTQPLGTKCYLFNKDPKTDLLYIQFPDDVDTTVGQGINISYIRTLGQSGNIKARQLEQFYSEGVATSIASETTLSLNSENFTLFNVNASTDGKDPETIGDAYTNYKRTVGTFNTLVTLRDYINYLITSGMVANGVVTDRTNDIQDVYYTYITRDGVRQKYKYIEKDAQGNNLMSAFDLKLYLMESVTKQPSVEMYRKSFELIPNGTISDSNPINNLQSIWNILSDQDGVGLIQHDIKEIENDKICIFKNKYKVNCKIIPTGELSVKQKTDVIKSITSALYRALNSSKVNFGEGIDYEYILQIIKNSSSLIRTVILDDINYDTYAVMHRTRADGAEYFEDILISGEPKATLIEKSATVVSIGSSDYYETTFSALPINNLTKFDFSDLNAIKDAFSGGYFNYSSDDGFTKVYILPSDISKTTIEKVEYIQITDKDNNVLLYIPQPTVGTDTVRMTFYLKKDVANLTGAYFYFEDAEAYNLQRDIFAKSVLAYTTPLLNTTEENFEFNVNQTNINPSNEFYSDVTSVTTDSTVTLTMSKGSTSETGTTYPAVEYTLADNEVIEFWSPNAIDVENYSNYVKYFLDTSIPISKGTSYALKQNEYIVLCWKEADANGTENDYYNYYKYTSDLTKSAANIVKPNVTLKPNMSDLGTYMGESIDSEGPIYGWKPVKELFDGLSVGAGQLSSFLSEKVSELYTGYILTGTNQINMQKVNTVTLPTQKQSTIKCYWILNNPDNILVNWSGVTAADNKKSFTYDLQSNEYFLYTDSSYSSLQILGSGTRLELFTTSGNNSIWKRDTIDLTQVQTEGLNFINKNAWFDISLSDGNSFTATEMQYVSIPAGNPVKFTAKQTDITELKLSSSGSTYTTKAGEDTIEKPVVNFTQLFDIQYGSPSVSLPTYEYSSDIGWQGRTRLNINAGISSPQKLIYAEKKNRDSSGYVDSQSFVLNGLDNTVYPVTIKPDEAAAKSSPNDTETEEEYKQKTSTLYIASSYDIDVLGGTDVDVTLTDVYDNITNATFYVYSQKEFEDGLTLEQSYTFKIPKGNYLIPFKNIKALEATSEFVVTITNSSGPVDGAFQWLRDYFSLEDKGINLGVLRLTQDVELNMSFSNVEEADKASILIEPFIKFEENEYLAKYLTTVINLDKDYKYDFTYKISEDTNIIDNPLNPKSFLESNHIYNKFTICEMRTNDTVADKNLTIDFITKSL